MITDQETRIFLYKLQTLGMIRCIQERKNGMYECEWKLTDTGEQFIEKYPAIRKLWKEQKIRELYQAINNRRVTVY